jgi:hypothetical protein
MDIDVSVARSMSLLRFRRRPEFGRAPFIAARCADNSGHDVEGESWADDSGEGGPISVRGTPSSTH